MAVCDLLVDAFPDLFDCDFTAMMEDQLDDIANGEGQRLAMLRDFWARLGPALERARRTTPRVIDLAERTDESCPECGGELVKRWGKHGPFVGCANYPRCRYIQKRKPKTIGRSCPECGAGLVIRTGKRGQFVGCSGYPTCWHTEALAA